MEFLIHDSGFHDSVDLRFILMIVRLFGHQAPSHSSRQQPRSSISLPCSLFFFFANTDGCKE